MTYTPSTQATTRARAGLDLLAEMRALEDAWRAVRTAYTDEDGEIRPAHYRDYDEARGDHGIEVANRLENWIERLAETLDIGASNNQ
ncbi:hypothetical protein [Actinospica robiniae]|uniref:hypothetical protein n=1 Tax=Actinospica robiniae TaxID=304901 RepID=UPI00042724E5|nr:hypothetical protein [Actinospica robiniae]